MAEAKGSERAEEMVKILRSWQNIERQALSDTAEIIQETRSPLVRIIMEIIRNDSLMHHRVQQFLVDSLTLADVPISREDIAEVWEKLEAHDKVEKKTIKLAEQLRDQAWSPMHKQLLSYLLTDERKHDTLLEQLNELKVGLTKASGA